MFPLGMVALPGEVVPLHVFEPRYRQLVLDCLAADHPEFGIVLIERGSEVGGGDERASTGTRVALRTVAPRGGGRFEIVVVGLRRLTILEWLPDDPYPRADVEDWPDPPPEGDDTSERIDALLAQVETVRDLAVQVARPGQGERPGALTLNPDPVIAAYQLTAAVPLGAADRFRILGAASMAARLDALGGALDDVEALLRFRLAGPPPP